MEPSLCLPLAAEELMPHRPPMRLVDRLVEYADKTGVVEAEVAADGLLVDGEGRLDEIALAELMAQAYAVIKGYAARLDSLPVRKGFLVGIRKMQFERPVRAGDRLRIVIRMTAEVEEFALAEGEIRHGAERVAHGALKFWIPEKDA